MENNVTMGSMFPATFLKVADIQANPSKFRGVIISEIKMVEIEGDDKVKRQKPVIYFAGITQGFVLNKTNRTRLMSKFSFTDETPANRLIGKQIDLQVEKVESFGDLVDAIRIVL